VLAAPCSDLRRGKGCHDGWETSNRSLNNDSSPWGIGYPAQHPAFVQRSFRGGCAPRKLLNHYVANRYTAGDITPSSARHLHADQAVLPIMTRLPGRWCACCPYGDAGRCRGSSSQSSALNVVRAERLEKPGCIDAPHTAKPSISSPAIQASAPEADCHQRSGSGDIPSEMTSGD
jgi:hypothetical protein